MESRALVYGILALFLLLIFGFVALLTTTSAYSCYSTGAIIGSSTVETGSCLSSGKEAAYIVFGLGTLASAATLFVGLRRPRPAPSAS